jgi:CubicO group peptidase (beta-lactamase class C family)
VSIDVARQGLLDAIAARVFPAAAVEVGESDGFLWREALGTLTFDEGAAATSASTPFDLASLTKVIATTSAVLQLMSEDRVRLDDPVATLFPEWRGADREPVTVRDLLEHASGLSARLVDPPPDVRREFEHDICTMPLEYLPRSKSIYSDVGFILLGFLVADRGGAALAVQFDELAVRLPVPSVRERSLDATHIEVLTFALPANARRRAAPTRPEPGDSRRGRVLVGEVHDDYAASLGGVAGHAGLFGTAAAVGAFARLVLRGARGDESVTPPFSPALVRLATTKTRVPGSSRALGWDTMLPTSSCGTRMSALAFGHVGFTGTSLWIDPERDRYFVLLTNRVCGGGTLEEMRGVRRAFHDAAADL